MEQIELLVSRQRAWYGQGHTRPVSFRRNALQRLYRAVCQHEDELLAAMRMDLGKSTMEAYMCEVGLVKKDIHYNMRHVRSWARATYKRTPLTNFPALSRVYHDPYGVVLVMSPWNYPCLLTLEPLAGAIAAGNTVVVKPSAYSPATSAVIARIIQDCFPPEYVAVVTGGREENQALLDQRFDYIFFTGGVKVGKKVMEKASRYLTPVTLELGGKSPVIIDSTAQLRLAAKRIVFGKFLNCGQTCIAPDYILCHQAVREEFVELLKQEIAAMYGSHPLENKDYGKIINGKHFERLCGLMDKAKIVYGGATDAPSLRIEPTILDGVTEQDKVMGEEIFGPLLPVLSVQDMDEAYQFIASREHPLALYLFTNDPQVEKRFMALSFGGGCVNDTIIHLASDNMPFGGVGNSGMGRYHGRYTFDTFSREKAVVKRLRWPDIPLRYQPYTRWKEKLLHFALK